MHYKWVLIGMISIASVLTSLAQDKPEYSAAHIDTSLLLNAESIVRHETVQYTINDARTYTCHVNRAVTILREDASEIWVRIFYDKYSKVDIQFINIYDAHGHLIRKVKKTELRDMSTFDGISLFTDNRWIGFQALGGSLPYTIETQYEQRYSQTMYYSPWSITAFNQSAERGKCIVDAPVDMVFHTRTLNHDFKYTVTKVNDRQIYQWSAEKILAIEYVRNGPPSHEVLPYVFISPATFEVDEFAGSMTDWKSFGRFIYELNKGQETMPSDMVDMIHRMTRVAATELEKIDTLYRWLQNNMRYVSVQLGIGGWRSFDAEYVDKNRYGDCKALSTFMKGMLEVAGIEAHTYLIDANVQDNLFMDDFVFPAFNHMMLYVPGQDMWLECTSQYLQPGQLYDVVENKKVLLITPEGGVISRTKRSSSYDNVIHQVDTIQLGSTINLSGRTYYTGSTQVDAIYRSHRSAAEQQKYFLEEFPFSTKTLDSFEFHSDPDGDMFHQYEATLQQLGTTSGGRLFIPVRSFIKPLDPCVAGVDRSLDFVSHDNYTVIRETYLRIPDDYKVEYLTSNVELIFQNQSYALEFSQLGQYIKIQTVVSKSPMRLSPVEYKDWCNFGRELSKAVNQQVILVGVKP